MALGKFHGVIIPATPIGCLQGEVVRIAGGAAAKEAKGAKADVAEGEN